MSDKQTQLIEAAIDLFAKEGFWNTPTSKIAKHAGVATGTLFNYFESKNDLIDAVYLQLKHEWSTHIMTGITEDQAFKAVTEHMWFRFIDWGINNPVRYTLMMQLKISNLVSQEAQRRQEEEMAVGLALVQKGIADGIIGDVDPDYYGRVLIAQLEASVAYAMKHQLKDMALTKHITKGFDLFWDGVSK
ncbi:MAG: TetR/AcrR family transcriptional regulator [Chloroflexota bacterium]